MQRIPRPSSTCVLQKRLENTALACILRPVVNMTLLVRGSTLRFDSHGYIEHHKRVEVARVISIVERGCIDKRRCTVRGYPVALMDVP